MDSDWSTEWRQEDIGLPGPVPFTPQRERAHPCPAPVSLAPVNYWRALAGQPHPLPPLWIFYPKSPAGVRTWLRFSAPASSLPNHLEILELEGMSSEPPPFHFHAPDSHSWRTLHGLFNMGDLFLNPGASLIHLTGPSPHYPATAEVGRPRPTGRDRAIFIKSLPQSESQFTHLCTSRLD